MVEVESLGEKEKAAAQAGSAPFVNRFFINIGPVVRIAFAEQWGPDDTPQFRAAITMVYADAIALKDTLGSLLAQLERQIEEARKKASERNG